MQLLTETLLVLFDLIVTCILNMHVLLRHPIFYFFVPVNNIHPQVNVNDDIPRSHGSHSRTSSSNRYPSQSSDPSLASHEEVRSSHRSSSSGRYSGSSQHPPVDNGLPDSYPHGSQHSPTVR